MDQLHTTKVQLNPPPFLILHSLVCLLKHEKENFFELISQPFFTTWKGNIGGTICLLLWEGVKKSNNFFYLSHHLPCNSKGAREKFIFCLSFFIAHPIDLSRLFFALHVYTTVYTYVLYIYMYECVLLACQRKRINIPYRLPEASKFFPFVLSIFAGMQYISNLEPRNWHTQTPSRTHSPLAPGNKTEKRGLVSSRRWKMAPYLVVYLPTCYPN